MSGLCRGLKEQQSCLISVLLGGLHGCKSENSTLENLDPWMNINF